MRKCIIFDDLVPDPMHLDPWVEQDEPLASDRHHDQQTYCFSALRYLLNPDGHYVAMDRWLRMDPNDSGDKLLPDLLIAMGLLEQQWNVDHYLPWEVGKAPEILGEFLSPSSVEADLVDKPRRYGEVGVREYFVFDPDGRFGVPRIQGWSLHGSSDRIPMWRDDDGGMASQLVPVRFTLVEGHIGVVDTRTGLLTLTYGGLQQALFEERAARRQADVARRQADVARRQADVARRQAETENLRLRAELERRNAEDEG